MADRFVDLQDHLIRREQEIACVPVGQFGRREQLERLGRDARGRLEKPGLLENLEAALAAVGVAAERARLRLGAFVGARRERRQDEREALAQMAAVGAHEQRVAFAVPQARLPVLDRGVSLQAFVQTAQELDLVAGETGRSRAERTGLAYSPVRGGRTRAAGSTRPRCTHRDRPLASTFRRRAADRTASNPVVAAYPMPPSLEHRDHRPDVERRRGWLRHAAPYAQLLVALFDQAERTEIHRRGGGAKAPFNLVPHDDSPPCARSRRTRPAILRAPPRCPRARSCSRRRCPRALRSRAVSALTRTPSTR